MGEECICANGTLYGICSATLSAVRNHKRWLTALSLVIVLALLLIEASAEAAQSAAYKAATTRWQAASDGFAGWTRSGLAPDRAGALLLDPATALPATDPYAPRSYGGRNFYNGGRHVVGEA